MVCSIGMSLVDEKLETGFISVRYVVNSDMTTEAVVGVMDPLVKDVAVEKLAMGGVSESVNDGVPRNQNKVNFLHEKIHTNLSQILVITVL